MRNYQVLDSAVVEKDNVLRLSTTDENPENPGLAMSREGAFLSLSASFGPLEIALRLQHADVARRLKDLHPVPGLATTRQIGTANSYIGLGLTSQNRLVMRPTIVGDASGRVTLNLVTSADVYQTILKWLDSDSDD